MLAQGAQAPHFTSPQAAWPAAACRGAGLPELPAGLAPLHSIGTRIRYGRGETVFSEGDAATHVYRVICGAVRLCKHMPDGRRQIVDFRLPGDFFGLMPVSAYVFTAEVVTDAVIVSYPRTQVERLGEQFVSVRHGLVSLLSEAMLGMHSHLVMLGRQTAKERLAGFLHKLAARADAANGDTVELPMSRQDIADYLGLTIETVCRELSALKKSRIVAAPDLHSIVLRNARALERVAAGN
jgi:CRP/FNR family nitrogen fixation transcriptional regulator